MLRAATVEGRHPTGMNAPGSGPDVQVRPLRVTPSSRHAWTMGVVSTHAIPDAGAELARLRAERDELRVQVATLQQRKHERGRWRQLAAGALVILSCLILVASVIGIWARRNFLDTDRFVDRAGPLIEQPSVQEALATRLTDQLMLIVDPEALFAEALPERGQLLAVPLANAVEGFVRDRVESFVATEQFERLWVGAVSAAHSTSVRVLRGESAAVTADNGQVTLNLVPVVNAVLAQITAESPEILGRQVNLPDVSVDDIPEAAIARVEDALGIELDDDFGQFTVYDDGTLEAAQRGVDLFDRFVVVLLPLGLAIAAWALWLSHRRRRTLLQLCAGIALGMVLVRRVGFRLQDEVASLPPTAAGRRAAADVAEPFVDPLVTFAALTLGAVALIAAIAVATGPYPWAITARRSATHLAARAAAATTERSRDEATVVWVAQHRDTLLIAGAVFGLALLWIADLSWMGLALVVGLVAVFELAVYRIAGRPGAAPHPP